MKLKAGHSKCSVCRQLFALPPKCLFCIPERAEGRDRRRKPEPPAISSETLEKQGRDRENSVILSRLAKFGKIVRFKGRTLDFKSRQDFESQAMYCFYRSVRLHLRKWEEGGNDRLLTAIAMAALNWTLKRRQNRQKIIDSMGRRL